MPDINAEINKKQQQNLKKSSKRYPDTQLCKCSKKKQRPLNAQCLTVSIVYQTNNTANILGYKLHCIRCNSNNI